MKLLKKATLSAAALAAVVTPALVTAQPAAAATTHSCTMSYYDSYSRSYDTVTGYWYALPGPIFGTMKIYATFYRTGEFAGRINYGNPYAQVGSTGPILNYEGYYQYVTTTWGLPYSVKFSTQRQDLKYKTNTWQSCYAR